MTSKKKQIGFRRSAVVALKTLALFAFVYIVSLFIPAVEAVRSANGVTLHCELLGEYPSDIEKIEIFEAKGGRKIWHVQAQGRTFQIHKFSLVPGLNAGTLQPFWGDFQTVLPTRGTFELKQGTKYRVSVCFANWVKLCRSDEFTL